MSKNAQAETLAKIRALQTDFEYYAPACLKIRSKSGEVNALTLNKAQQYLHGRIESQIARTGKVRLLVVKGRQQGVSTYVEGRFYWRVSQRTGVRAFILTHEQDASDNLYEMAKRYHEHAPDCVKPQTKASNAKELDFAAIDSGYRVGTAGSKGVGRSSTVQYFHGCLSPDTWVIDAQGGAVRMGGMVVGDMVRTHSGELAPISFISKQEKIAKRIILKGMGSLPIVATEEHQFLTQDGWRELSKIAVDDVLLFPVASIVDVGMVLPFRLPDATRKHGGGSGNHGPKTVIPSSYALGRILGLYLAEGCIIKQKSRSVSAVTFSIHEREAVRTEKWLDSVGHLFVSRKTATRKASKAVTVTAYGRSFAAFVCGLCGELDSKRLPIRWREMGKPFVRGLVHGYLSGDGHSSKRPGDRRISAPSIRSAITFGMRDALASLGYGWACVSYRSGAIRNGRNERAQWTLRLSGVGVDALCKEIIWAMPERKRHGSYGDVQVVDGYAHIPVIKIEDVGAVSVMDFEVDHQDHSYCTIHSATHNSEVAFWPHADQHLAGVLQAVPDEPGTEVILESTANGVGGVFHQLVVDAQHGKGEYELVFIPWFWTPEYRAEGAIVLDDEELALAKLYKLDHAQIAWRRKKIHELKSSDLFKQEYPCSVEEAFLFSGRSVFERKHTATALHETFKPDYRCVIDAKGTIVKRDDGELRVWAEPKKVMPYVIGADVAEGLAHGDYSCAMVLDGVKGQLVAEWHGHIAPDLFGKVLVDLAERYNDALIGVERNNHGLTTITKIKDLCYPNLYAQEDVERINDGTLTKKAGWLTTSKSKPKIIDQLAAEFRDGDHGIWCIDTIKECQTYVIEENGSYNAAIGCYDDRVMARAIAGEMFRYAWREPRTPSKNKKHVGPADDVGGY